MDRNAIIQGLIDKTFREIEEADKPLARSRIASTTNGYIYLVAWSDASLLRLLIRKFTSMLAFSEKRLKAQLDDAARSVVANIEEGYSRPTTIEYLTFLGYSQASLVEVKGDIERSYQDNFLHSLPRSTLASIGIDLSDWHEALKQTVQPKEEDKGKYGRIKENGEQEENKERKVFAQSTYSTNRQNILRQSDVNQCFAHTSQYQNESNQKSFDNTKHNFFSFHYPPVDTIQIHRLTYEIFIELINKTDWNLRKLVVSLEGKLGRDRKYYQVEQARLRGKANWKK